MIAAHIVVALALTQTPPAESKPAPTLPAPESTPRPLPVLTLLDAIELARHQNLDIKQVNARLDQARQLSWKAWSFYLPQIALGATYTRNQLAVDIGFPVGYYVTTCAQGSANCPAPPTNLPAGETYTGSNATLPSTIVSEPVQTLNQGQGQLALNQALIAPTTWSSIANAYTQERVADYNSQQQRRDLLFTVAQLYYSLASLKQLALVQERQLELTQERERDARVRYNAGTSPKVGLLRAQIDRAQAEEDLKRAQIDYQKAKISLATALDRDENFEVENPRSPKPPVGPNLLEQAMELRPDVKAANENVKGAEGQRTQAFMEYLPNVGGFLKILYSNVTIFTGQTFVWAAGLGLTWNILDGGLREATIREADAKIVEAKAARDSVDLHTAENVKQFQLELEAAIANKAKAKERAEFAEENAKLVDVAYKAGAATYLESTDSIQTLRQAEVTLVAESLNVDVATLRLLNAVGAFQEVNN